MRYALIHDRHEMRVFKGRRDSLLVSKLLVHCMQVSGRDVTCMESEVFKTNESAAVGGEIVIAEAATPDENSPTHVLRSCATKAVSACQLEWILSCHRHHKTWHA